MLDERLSALFGTVDLERAYEVLREAKGAAQLAAWEGRGLDERRETLEETELVARNLRKWARRGIDLYMKHEAFDSQVLQNLFSLQDAMRQDPAMARTSNRPPLRREARGRPPRPWIAAAHRGLRRAGVTKAEIRRELLDAVGLISLART